jgi:hypothetical protein
MMTMASWRALFSVPPALFGLGGAVAGQVLYSNDPRMQVAYAICIVGWFFGAISLLILVLHTIALVDICLSYHEDRATNVEHVRSMWFIDYYELACSERHVSGFAEWTHAGALSLAALIVAIFATLINVFMVLMVAFDSIPWYVQLIPVAMTLGMGASLVFSAVVGVVALFACLGQRWCQRCARIRAARAHPVDVIVDPRVRRTLYCLCRNTERDRAVRDAERGGVERGAERYTVDKAHTCAYCGGVRPLPAPKHVGTIANAEANAEADCVVVGVWENCEVGAEAGAQASTEVDTEVNASMGARTDATIGVMPNNTVFFCIETRAPPPDPPGTVAECYSCDMVD